MTDNNHPMLPTQEQLTEWDSERFDEGENFDVMMIKAFQAGADQELEACCSWVSQFDYDDYSYGDRLRAARRGRATAPSLKEQALKALKNIDDACESEGFSRSDDTDIIRRALEALPD